MSVNTSILRAEALFRQKNFQQSLELCQKLLDKKPKLLDARQILALSYQALGLLEQAKEEFKLLIQSQKNNASNLNNLGNIYHELNQLEQAVYYYQKALKIEPMMATGHNNLATCLSKFGEIEQAELHYKKAILADGQNPEFTANLGIFYLNQGHFNAALEMLLKAMTASPEYSLIYWQVCKAFMYSHRYQDALEAADIAIASGHLNDYEYLEMQIARAIMFWLFNNREEAQLAIAQSEAIAELRETSANAKNMAIFHDYVKRLLAYAEQHPELYQQNAPVSAEQDEQEPIYFISESHGFAPNQTLVQYQGKNYKIQSLFIFGAKVFHLINERDNQYRASLFTLLSGLAAGSKVVIGFGEIDCRSSEGIFVYCQKNGANYQSVIDDMLSRYTALLTDIAKQVGIELILYGVPAPHPSQLEKLSAEQQQNFKQLVAYYNQSLQQHCQRLAMDFLDVYQLTNQDGLSNNQYHIDYYHVKPATVGELFSSL